ncbi:UNVERIFIED_CONTAM: hypothetical protein GTU68_024183 [Idotea baltica]|nr:hypothetical protein [Idotea baltica]
MTRIAINGFGRIGRLTFRNLINQKNVNIVAINDLTDNATLAHLLKYDSTHGRFDGDTHLEGDVLTVNGDAINLYAERDPKNLPWADLNVDVVLECTGIFTSEDEASWHLEAGAKKVVLSAPSKGGDIKTIVIGVNDEEISDDIKIYSNASCTTNCFAPMVKLIDQKWGIKQGTMTTIHGYTADQKLQDAPHKDLRRSRAAAINIVPTSTGAAKATAIVYPPLGTKVEAMAVRVPVVTGSLVDFTAFLDKEATVEEVNTLFKEASQGAFKGVIEYCEDPVVSTDIVGNKHSNIFDSLLTKSQGNMISVVGWYDNEAGYSARLAQLALMI